MIGHAHGLFGERLVLKGRRSQNPRSERDEQGKNGEYSAVHWRNPRERKTSCQPEHNAEDLEISVRSGRVWFAIPVEPVSATAFFGNREKYRESIENPTVSKRGNTQESPL
jgi:hypothetical protein